MLTKQAESLDRKKILKEMELFLKSLRIHRRAIPDTPSKINRLELIRINRLMKKIEKSSQSFNAAEKKEPIFNKLKLYHYRIMEELATVKAELEKHSSPVMDDTFYTSAALLYKKVSKIL